MTAAKDRKEQPVSKIHPSWDNKRKRGDRFDGTLIKDLDPMHVITPVLYPNRCDNEAFFMEKLDITRVRAYVRKKNIENPDTLVKYSTFHMLVTAILKLLCVRSKLNRFIVNRLMYQRNELTASFVVKKIFSDDGAEALAIISADENDNVDTLHEKIAAQITSGRSEKVDKSSESMDIVSRMPRRLTRLFCQFICFLDKIGHCPKGLIDTDPYYTSVVITNLGSIGLKAGYHHLTNWGTASIFVTLGEVKREEVEEEDGTKSMHDFIDIGMTIDERLADGFYYSKSLRLLKRILQDPEMLEQPLNTLIK